MPLSPTERDADIRNTLVALVRKFGDRQVVVTRFNGSYSGFDQVLPTTWRELLDAGMIEDTHEKPGPVYRLTALGWRTGLQLDNAIAEGSIAFERAVAIKVALKARVKGRQAAYDFPLDVRDLATKLQIPVEWLWNAMASNLLEVVFPKHRVEVGFERLLIKIPPIFDSPK